MSRAQGKGGRQSGGKAFGSLARPGMGFGAFSSASTGNGLSYLAEPPDLSSISDANVVVSFKNLLKKDSTTKSKALEELVAYVQAHPYEQDGGTEEAIVEAWVQLYPRVSIDNSRRVRELSHALQFELMKSARKRMEKHVPQIVGSWLAGLYDKDRVVSRSANDGLSSFLNTPEKIVQFWKRCQPQILEYATDAIQETQETLSDERSTTPDDAEAKFFRVVGSSIFLVQGLLQKLDQVDVEKEHEAYDKFFTEDKVWKSATFNDSTVRKAACQLLWICLEKRMDSLTPQAARLKKIFVYEGLKSSQTGSAIEYVRVLTKLTQKFPDLWSASSSEKRSPLSRLHSLLEKGSQGSAIKYWEYLEQLLLVVARDQITVAAATGILASMRLGISNREEPRTHAPAAWTCYVHSAKHFVQALPTDSPFDTFLQDNLFPLTDHFIFPTPKSSSWEIGGSSKLAVLVEAYSIVSESSVQAVSNAATAEWERLASSFCSRISNSLPEVSKDYQKSQEAIAEEGDRWFSLVGQIHLKNHSARAQGADITQSPSRNIITSCINLLVNRNLKPYGAAGIIYNAGKSAPHLWDAGQSVSELEQFLHKEGKERMEVLVTSRSFADLLSCIGLLGSNPLQLAAYSKIWTTWIESLLRLSDEESATSGISKLISHESATTLAKSHEPLQQYLSSRCSGMARGTIDAWKIFEVAFSNAAITEDVATGLVNETMGILSNDKQNSANALRALEIIASNRPDLLSGDGNVHTILVTELLGLMEINDAVVSSRASSLRAMLEHPSDGKPPVISIIQRNLEDANPQSLAIDTLVQQALQASKLEGVNIEDLFPSTNTWMQQLVTFLQDEIDPSLSITSSAGGAHFLVRTIPSTLPRTIRRDRAGLSILGRMSLYTTRLISSGIPLDSLPQGFQVEILYLLGIAIQLATDQITLLDKDKLWESLSPIDGLLAAEDFVSSTRAILNSLVGVAKGWRDGSATGPSDLIDALIDIMIQQTHELSPLGLYSSRALSELFQTLTEKHGFPSAGDEKLSKFDKLKSSPSTVLAAVAIVTGFGESLESSKLVGNLCNRLVSDIAGASAQSEKTLITIVLLNACLQVYEVGEIPVPSNRLVFAVRQITSWLDNPTEVSSAMSAEVCRALQRLLPCIKDVYGPYWEKTIDFCTALWARAADYPIQKSISSIHASLKLMSTLDALSEPNDDLVDAMHELAETKSHSLLELLKLPRDHSTQPLDIVDALICRLVDKIPLTHVTDLSDLYGLVASESRDIQTAAFSILHRALPSSQEQLSLDVLLDKKDARLPDELLSLLLDAPTLDKYPDEILLQFPTVIRSYLLSWHLVFDAYSSASFKVRNDYTEHLKTGNYVGPLMEFAFDVLGHSAAHPLNLDKEGFSIENIRGYDLKLADSEPEERNLHWLLIHVYYLSLKYIPGLFKAWYIDCRSKQTKIAVESWMTKYFSPLIISDTLDEVAVWAESQEPPADDEKELVVKVSKLGKEITAGYEIDESFASIAIKVPSSYPIDGVNVVGVHRVAVNEKKWQSWLMTTQGVITFSNGSIIDGLTAFRRNIVGALKGQSECAICYSIISTDKKMPDKRCQTCKNLFHRTCLYKWFQSSNQNTCPLCRNPIDYLGSDTKARRAG